MVEGGEVTVAEVSVPDEPTVRATNHSPALSAIDITVRWGDWVLSSHELSPPRGFVVGEENCDATLPAEVLGAPMVPVLLARWDGDVRLVVAPTARVLIGGRTKRMSASRCISRGFGQASTNVPNAAEVALLPGQTATLFFQAIAIDVKRTDPAERTPRALLVEKRLVLAQCASFALHAFVLFVFMFFARPVTNDDEGISDDQRFELSERLNRLAEKDWDLRGDRDGYMRRARRNERRLMLALLAKQDEWMEATSRGWTDELAAQAARNEAPRGSDGNLIGVLYDWPTPEPTTRPVAPPPRETRPMNTTIPADTSTYRGRGPRLRQGAASVSGRLPPEVIQRIVRQNFGRFRLCYENGLRNNPNLQGRVSVRFIIGRDGAISNVSNGGSDMPDSGVVSCVMRSFYGLSFPQPEGGIVSVVFPIMFSPGD